MTLLLFVSLTPTTVQGECNYFFIIEDWLENCWFPCATHSNVALFLLSKNNKLQYTFLLIFCNVLKITFD